MGIEPTYQAWKACVLPLNYARGDVAKFVGLCRTRTYNLILKRDLLYH